jgi:hypothetical protein
MRWLHDDLSLPISGWQTPLFAQVKKKKTSRVSQYVESELWEQNDLLNVIKYESHKRNRAALTHLWDLDARNHVSHISSSQTH